MAWITAHIFRFDPEKDDKPRYADYRVEVNEETSVLVLIDRIQREMDESLSFRSYCCGLQMCKSCLLRINQKKRLACLTIVRPGEEVTIDPATYPEGHIRDLTVRREDGGTEVEE